MTKPEVLRCPDHHFRRILWGLGPYIADYQEQLIVSCIVQYWCARYVIHTRRIVHLLFNFVHRCRALPNNLDGPESSDRRSRAHTNFLLGKCEVLSVLYKDYGIIGNVVVCIQTIWIRFFSYSKSSHSHSPMISLGPTYMNSSLQISFINLLRGFLRTIW